MSQEKQKYSVVTEFRDKNNFEKVYSVGEDVSHLGEQRLSTLEGLNIVEKVAPKVEAKATPEEKVETKSEAKVEAKATDKK